MSKSIELSSLTPLQVKVVRQIVGFVRRELRRQGDHLREVELAQYIGTSRSPVQVALRFLASAGVLQQDLNRGYFLSKDASQWHAVVSQLAAQPADPLYQKLVQDRLAGRLPNEVGESEMMRRYQVARSSLRKVLARISEEGWVEQKLGHGWSFLPMIDSSEAYEESYLFRLAIEPVGLLSPAFLVDTLAIAQLQREQENIVQGGYKTMSAIELFEANSRFHETLASWSGNRFIAQAVRRVNLQRRLVEYHQVQAAKRPLRQTQAHEHVQILEAIARQDFMTAASAMRHHLDGARRGKTRLFKGS
jgi:DNA-binding GntR family transcriptional regulator